jgi:hypothetical protein
MKKRHVTELTGRELSAAFSAAVTEAWAAAAARGLDVHGRQEALGVASSMVRKPDGSVISSVEQKPDDTSRRKRTAA